MTIPLLLCPLLEFLRIHRRDPICRVTQEEKEFILAMRDASRKGVGYGWMQQIIEWEWQDKSGEEMAWGPEWHMNLLLEDL